MATITREPVAREAPRREIADRLLVPGFWASICIALDAGATRFVARRTEARHAG